MKHNHKENKMIKKKIIHIHIYTFKLSLKKNGKLKNLVLRLNRIVLKWRELKLIGIFKIYDI